MVYIEHSTIRVLSLFPALRQRLRLIRIPVLWMLEERKKNINTSHSLCSSVKRSPYIMKTQMYVTMCMTIVLKLQNYCTTHVTRNMCTHACTTCLVHVLTVCLSGVGVVLCVLWLLAPSIGLAWPVAPWTREAEGTVDGNKHVHSVGSLCILHNSS